MLNLPPLNKQLIAEAVKEIIDQTGQPLFFEYILGRSICPTCAGTDDFCPTCSGDGVVEETTEKEYIGKVIWKESQRKKINPKGWQDFSGDCQVTIYNDGLLNEILFKTKHVRIGTNILYLHSYNLGGLDNNRYYIRLLFTRQTDGVRTG